MFGGRSSSEYITKTTIIPDGCNYIIFSIYDNDSSEIQITKGTTPKPYLPHGCIGLEQSGKNLAYDGWAEECASRIASGTSVEFFENRNCFKYPCNASWTVYSFNENKYLFKADWKANTQYTFKFDIYGSKPFSNLQILYTDGTETNFGNITAEAWVNITKTSDANKTIKAIYTAWAEGYNYIDLDTFMVYEGTGDEEYEPYHSPKVYPINLNGNSIAKVGDVKDLLKVYRNGDVEIEKNVGKTTIKLESIIDLKNGIVGSVVMPNNKKSETDGICNKAKLKFYSADGTNYFYNNPAVFVFVGDKNDTLEMMKQKYDGAELYYQLATPETIKLPSIEPIELWEGTNNFKLITNLDTTFEVEYIVNKDSVLNEVQTAMLEAEIEI